MADARDRSKEFFIDDLLLMIDCLAVVSFDKAQDSVCVPGDREHTRAAKLRHPARYSWSGLCPSLVHFRSL